PAFFPSPRPPPPKPAPARPAPPPALPSHHRSLSHHVTCTATVTPPVATTHANPDQPKHPPNPPAKPPLSSWNCAVAASLAPCCAGGGRGWCGVGPWLSG